MTRRDALVGVIEALHAEIAALKSHDNEALERATGCKLAMIDALAAAEGEPATAEIRALADEAKRLNDTCRIYVNLLSANVRRRIERLTGTGAASYRPALA